MAVRGMGVRGSDRRHDGHRRVGVAARRDRSSGAPGRFESATSPVTPVAGVQSRGWATMGSKE